MGCGSSKNSVAPDPSFVPEDVVGTIVKPKRNTKSGKSNASQQSNDSGFDDSASNDSIQASDKGDINGKKRPKESPLSQDTSNDVNTVSTSTVSQEESNGSDELTPLSPPPLKQEESILDMKLPRPSMERPLSRKGVAFEISLDTNMSEKTATPKRMPPRLKAIVTTPKRELTLLELDRKLRTAEKLRKERINQVSKKALNHNRKVETVDEKLARERTTLDETTTAKEKAAIDNRRKHMRDLQQRLSAKEAHAKKVRARASSADAVRIKQRMGNNMNNDVATTGSGALGGGRRRSGSLSAGTTSSSSSSTTTRNGRDMRTKRVGSGASQRSLQGAISKSNSDE